MTLTLYDRIYGSLLGSAVGDALGAPTECMHYRDIQEFFGNFCTFEELAAAGVQTAHPIGAVTDDTVLCDLLLDAILDHEGEINAYTFAEAWERFDLPVDVPGGESYSRLDHVHWIERIPFYRNKLRDIHKRDLGRGEANATNAIMYIAPVGLLCAGDPILAELMAVDVTSVNQHGGPRDVAGGYCAALASCFVSDSVDEIVSVALCHTREARHTAEIGAMVDLARTCATCTEFIERYYTEIIGPVLPFQDWQHRGKVRPTGRPTSVSWNSSEVLGPVLATFAITQGRDAQTMMLACARIGRDADTIARVAGGLVGAYLGADAIPKVWVDYVLPRNRWLRLKHKAAQLAELTAQRLRRNVQAAQSYADLT